MSTLTKSTRQYNPRPIHRKVRLQQHAPDGQVHFKSYSMTRPGHDIEHKPVVDVATGYVTCTCEDFRFRHDRHEPSVLTPQHWCKHVDSAIQNLIRRGELVLPQTACPDTPRERAKPTLAQVASDSYL